MKEQAFGGLENKWKSIKLSEIISAKMKNQRLLSRYKNGEGSNL